MFKKWRWVAPLPLVLWVLGCGTTHQTTVTHPAGEPKTLTFSQAHGAPCHPRNPPSLGECVSQRFGFRHIRHPERLKAFTGKECADWSQWQGYHPATYGLSCVIIQSNYGLHVEPSVYSQVRDAKEHHVACGLYTFMEGNSGSSEASVAARIYKATGCTLGLWADAEIGAAYSHACAYTAAAHRLGVAIVGLYSSPGLWPGGACTGKLWPAEWGRSRAYPFGGYSYSAIVLHQTCGTCWRGGVETDLDVDYGLIGSAHHETPAEHKASQRKRLYALYRVRGHERQRLRVLKRVLLHYGCSARRHHHSKLGPRCVRWFGEGDRVHVSGARHNREINKLHREGVW